MDRATRIERLLQELRKGPKTSLQLQLAVGSSAIRSLCHCLRMKGYVIEAQRLPSFGDESTIYQYRLIKEPERRKDAQGRSKQSTAAQCP